MLGGELVKKRNLSTILFQLNKFLFVVSRNRNYLGLAFRSTHPAFDKLRLLFSLSGKRGGKHRKMLGGESVKKRNLSTILFQLNKFLFVVFRNRNNLGLAFKSTHPAFDKLRLLFSLSEKRGGKHRKMLGGELVKKRNLSTILFQLNKFLFVVYRNRNYLGLAFKSTHPAFDKLRLPFSVSEKRGEKHRKMLGGELVKKRNLSTILFQLNKFLFVVFCNRNNLGLAFKSTHPAFDKLRLPFSVSGKRGEKHRKMLGGESVKKRNLSTILFQLNKFLFVVFRNRNYLGLHFRSTHPDVRKAAVPPSLSEKRGGKHRKMLGGELVKKRNLSTILFQLNKFLFVVSRNRNYLGLHFKSTHPAFDKLRLLFSLSEKSSKRQRRKGMSSMKNRCTFSLPIPAQF
jgi:hypothetical protein